jgi:hypothetical protein
MTVLAWRGHPELLLHVCHDRQLIRGRKRYLARFTRDRFEKPQANRLISALRSWRAMTMRWIWLVPS